MEVSRPLLDCYMTEMAVLDGQGKDCWLGRVEEIGQLLDVPTPTPRSAGKIIGRHIKNKFSSFWLQEVNSVRQGSDGVNHNKLRTYSRFKGFFGVEEYLFGLC